VRLDLGRQEGPSQPRSACQVDSVPPDLDWRGEADQLVGWHSLRAEAALAKGLSLAGGAGRGAVIQLVADSITPEAAADAYTIDRTTVHLDNRHRSRGYSRRRL
jgi:hypothetical protein